MTPEEATKILADVPTAYLLDELDRRRLAAQPAEPPEPPRVQFFGVWPGERFGHYLRDRDGRKAWNEVNPSGRVRHTLDGDPERTSQRRGGLYPWDTMGDGCRREQPEGKLWHWYNKGLGLTVLTSWDRSEDTRGNCAASFVVHAIVTPEAALTMAREAFPRVFERIEGHLGRPVELAGMAEVIR